MGIPSYYKRLIDRFPRLVKKGIQQMSSDILLMDFNCLIYQCIRDTSLPAYSHSTREAWESALLDAVKAYTRKVWSVAGKPGTVFIGVDGVVPMAKIRQQRLRRFKSIWLAEKEMEAGVRKAGEEHWDTNAITPGTEFMEKLGRALASLGSSHTGWTVSGADEAGEGEQKLMSWVRSKREQLGGKRIVVYGLDADLIILSLLAVTREVPAVSEWSLLRELAEFEGARADKSASFGLLNVLELLNVLCPVGQNREEYILDYMCGMSFLGNDFLPHSLSIKMRQGGHDILCITLSDIHYSGKRLVKDGQVQIGGCAELVRRWALKEEAAVAEGFQHKYKMRPMPPRNDKEALMQRVQNLPIEWLSEDIMWSKEKGLVTGWRDIYRRELLMEAGVEQTCDEYLRGLQWILDYYLGKPVSYSWYFPWNVPPLWSELRDFMVVSEKAIEAPPPSSPVAPQEQLAMVLPMKSWRLVRESRLRILPNKIPVYWPSVFGFFSIGRRWMWECEAEIPILTSERMRQVITKA